MTLIISKGLTLDNGTRPAAIAGVAPTLDYRFARDKREIETVSLLDKLTYTGGNGTFVGSDGYIQQATTNVPRFDHDPLSRVSEGLLVEESRENLQVNSENLTGTTTFRMTVAQNQLIAPDGTQTADLALETVDTGSHIVRTNGGLPIILGNVYTVCVFVKPIGRTEIRLASASSNLPLDITFDLTGSGSPLLELTGTGAVKEYPNGWYRISGTSLAAVATTSIGVNIYSSSGAGDTAKGVGVWGAQAEVGTSCSSYIPTTASAVTRTADSATIDGTGILTGTYTIVEKPAGCAVESGGNIELQAGYTAERVMVFPASLSAQQITDIRSAM